MQESYDHTSLYVAGVCKDRLLHTASVIVGL